jgi:uncharacterized Zn ribbon protein
MGYTYGARDPSIAATSIQPEKCLDCHSELTYRDVKAGHLLCEACRKAATDRVEQDRRGHLIARANKRVRG